MTEREAAYKLWKMLDDAGVPDSPNFTNEEWAGLCEEAPMTFELFISCIEKCVEGKYVECYFDIIQQFPEYEDQFLDYLEKKDGIKKMTPEEVEESWLKFKKRYIDKDEQ